MSLNRFWVDSEWVQMRLRRIPVIFKPDSNRFRVLNKLLWFTFTFQSTLTLHIYLHALHIMLQIIYFVNNSESTPTVRSSSAVRSQRNLLGGGITVSSTNRMKDWTPIHQSQRVLSKHSIGFACPILSMWELAMRWYAVVVESVNK